MTMSQPLLEPERRFRPSEGVVQERTRDHFDDEGDHEFNNGNGSSAGNMKRLFEVHDGIASGGNRRVARQLLGYRVALVVSLFVVVVLSCFLVGFIGVPLGGGIVVAGVEQHNTVSTSAVGFRKALVIASWSQQDVSWLDDVSSDWEIHRYLSDLSDPSSPSSVPRHQGREAMAYLTYIIDHYADLPDIAVFVHGHNRSWHQPEPLALKLSALNASAVADDGYVNFRCNGDPGCGDETFISAAAVTEGEDRVQARLMPGFWRTLFPEAYGYWGLGPPPEAIGVACCAQFAVSRRVVQARPLEFWKMFRRPLTRDLGEYRESIGKGLDGYTVGMLYEKVWHIVFGKPAICCPDEEYCRKVQWSDAITCDRYTGDWKDSRGWENITCKPNSE